MSGSFSDAKTAPDATLTQEMTALPVLAGFCSDVAFFLVSNSKP